MKPEICLFLPYKQMQRFETFQKRNTGRIINFEPHRVFIFVFIII